MRWRNSLLVVLLPVFLFSQKVEFKGNPQRVKVKIRTEVEREYLLLEKDKPIIFKVDGPTYLRVYTRLVYPKGAKGVAIYKLILEEDEQQERIITKKTELSDKAYLDGKRLGKWRSFLIEVPPGKHTYKLGIWKSPSPQIAIRIRRTAPPVWKELSPLSSAEVLTAYEAEKKTNYYLLETGKTIKFRVDGPKRIKVVVRLNFDDSMGEEGGFTIAVKENGNDIERASFKTYRSDEVRWKNRKDVVPGKAQTFYFEIPKGKHVIEVELLGTLAKSAGIRLLIPEIRAE